MPGGPSPLGSGTQAQPRQESRSDARSRTLGHACLHSRVFSPQGAGRRESGPRSRASGAPCSANEANGADTPACGLPAPLHAHAPPADARADHGAWDKTEHEGHRPPARPPLPRAAARCSGALSFASARAARPTTRHSAGDLATRPRAAASRGAGGVGSRPASGVAGIGLSVPRSWRESCVSATPETRAAPSTVGGLRRTLARGRCADNGGARGDDRVYSAATEGPAFGVFP